MVTSYTLNTQYLNLISPSNLSKVSQAKNILIIPAVGLGDALFHVGLAQCLQNLQKKCTLYSSHLTPLKSLFQLQDCQETIDTPQKLQKINIKHSGTLILIQEQSPLAKNPPSNALVLAQEAFIPIGKQYDFFCKNLMKEASFEFSGIEIHKSLLPQIFGKYEILIHPTSSSKKKNWPLKKYLCLAKQLRSLAYDVKFCLGPNDHQEKSQIERVDPSLIWMPQNLLELAAGINLCTMLIGNDSGLGHFASLFTKPTVSLFASRTHAKKWRPSWGKNTIISPYILLPGRIKRLYWGKLTFVFQVLNAVIKILNKPKS